jgi:EAL domain-containing protein (putative c-di-GMP-specific phosphodiesterase class I)
MWNAAQLSFMRQLGCDYSQGCLLGKSLPLESPA